MKRLPRAAIALLCLVAAAAEAAPDSPPETALADYVAEHDDTFEWRVQARHEVTGAEIVELRLHSQTWRDTLWRHQLYVIRPDEADSDAQQGVLIIGGGRWRDRYDTEVDSVLPEDAALFIGIARQLGAVVAVLAQVPFQPIFGLREDELIAYTFEQYLRTGDAEWPLLLPMVKSAVRAMDAVQAFTADEWDFDLQRFTVSGGSKRGWTTWLTGAVDRRAATLVPIVIDVLNFEAHMPHQEAVWGEPSAELSPYTRRGLDEVLSTQSGRALRRIVDPYSYREQLTQPKLIVIGTNDPYFPLDSLNLYWDDLPEPKRILYLPNEGHDTEDFARLIPALNAMHRHGETGEPLPELVWEFEDDGAGLRLCVRADPDPAAVTAWSAESADRDFRDDRFSPRQVTENGGGVYVFEAGPEQAGFAAVFAEAVFGDGRGRYMLSTNVRVAGEGAATAADIRGRAGVCPSSPSAGGGG